jgi:HAT1-interacting factor 1
LKTSPNEALGTGSAPELVAQALDLELNTKAPNGNTANLPVNDLTSMVVKKKKKQPEEEPASSKRKAEEQPASTDSKRARVTPEA